MIGGGKGFGLRGPSGDERGAEAFAVPPFARLARTHVFAIAGDTLVTVALADSLFFSIDPNDARWRVALYLLFTMAPFAVVAPLLGPMMDRLRGGHRLMVLGTTVARGLVAILMARYINSLALFPLAFSMLVLGKTYQIARSAMVPSLVTDRSTLVQANSRLSLLSAVAGGVAAVPGAALLRLGGAPWVLTLTAFVFAAAAVLSLRIPRVQVATEEADAEERAELRGAGILLAASGMGYLRGVVGFLTMLLAFDLRGGVDPGPTGTGVGLGHRLRESLGLERLELSTGGSPAWHFGVVLIGAGLGGLLGSMLAPRLRAVLREEAMLTGVLVSTAALALTAALLGGLVGSFLASLTVATAAAAGKQAFDAIVQRDAPEANLGRSFSRFETRFQLIWVLGAFLPVIITLPARLGFILMAITAGFAAFTVYFGRSPLTRLQARIRPQVGTVGRHLGASASRAGRRLARRDPGAGGPGRSSRRRGATSVRRRDRDAAGRPPTAPAAGAEPTADLYAAERGDRTSRLDGSGAEDDTTELDGRRR